jgi:polysaccharide deacetylase 2 family uncharacterized protein YibQ
MAGREGKRKLVARRESSFKSIALLTLLPVVAFLGYFAYQWIRGGQAILPVLPHSAPSKGQAGLPVLHQAGLPVLQQHSEASVLAPQRHHRGDIVLILDDVGFDHQPIDEAMRIDPNVNFSILPNGSQASEMARRLHDRGFELLCHLPMEPIDYPRQSPGENAILISMSDDQITETTLANVGAVPHIRGVNNHMGSRATSDRRVMNDVLRALPKDLYFIDSRTSNDSIAGRMAKQMNIPTASRNVFLDDVQSERAVRRQVALLASLAAERGVAVGIGHPYGVTIRVLNDLAPALRARGFRFVRASDAVR